MNVPVGYDDDLEFRNTHPVLLPKNDKPGAIKAKEPNAPSRSTLGELGNRPLLEFLRAGGVTARVNIICPGRG